MLIQNLTNTLPSQTAPAKSVSAPEASLANPTQTTALKEPTTQELKNAVDTLNKAIKENHTNLDISVDSDTKDIVVKVVDTSNGDVITQFPSKVALAISASIDNKQKGVLLNNKA